MAYTYDANGNVTSVKDVQGQTTTYQHTNNNLTKEILPTGAALTYTYDIWSNPLTTTGTLATTLGTLNPLRYRGYVYDQETGIYYVSSRYYIPDTGRFLNPDILISTGQGILGNNMFAYCRNNPVNRVDVSGFADTPVEEEFDDDVEVAPALPEVAGGGNGSSGVQTGSVGSNGSSFQISISSSGIASALNPNNEKTEIHHIVQQCQIKKLDFLKSIFWAIVIS